MSTYVTSRTMCAAVNFFTMNADNAAYLAIPATQHDTPSAGEILTEGKKLDCGEENQDVTEQ